MYSSNLSFGLYVFFSVATSLSLIFLNLYSLASTEVNGIKANEVRESNLNNFNDKNLIRLKITKLKKKCYSLTL